MVSANPESFSCADSSKNVDFDRMKPVTAATALHSISQAPYDRDNVGVTFPNLFFQIAQAGARAWEIDDTERKRSVDDAKRAAS